MSSFLGVAQPGTGVVLLARNVAVAVNTTASTTLFTAAQACTVLGVVIRNGATAFGTTTSFKIMNGASTALPTTVATSLPASQAMVLPTAANTTLFPNVASGATVFYNTVQIDGGTATAATCDVYGYVY